MFEHMPHAADRPAFNNEKKTKYSVQESGNDSVSSEEIIEPAVAVLGTRKAFLAYLLLCFSVSSSSFSRNIENLASNQVDNEVHRLDRPAQWPVATFLSFCSR